MTSFAQYPDGVRGIESVFSPVDLITIVATCPCMDCGFDGDVDAEMWLLSAGLTERTFEAQWTCPHCGIEVIEDRTYVDGDDV